MRECRAILLRKTGQDANALAVHRLDQTTSGLVLFAKNKLAIAGLSWQMENRAIHRTYLAAVDGAGTRDADYQQTNR